MCRNAASHIILQRQEHRCYLSGVHRIVVLHQPHAIYRTQLFFNLMAFGLQPFYGFQHRSHGLPGDRRSDRGRGCISNPQLALQGLHKVVPVDARIQRRLKRGLRLQGLQQVKHGRTVAHGARQRKVNRGPLPLAADSRPYRRAPARRLQPEQAGEGGRDADRTAAVAGTRRRYDTGGYRCGGPAAGASGRAVRVPGIPGRPVQERLGDVF
ncbi:hypothetical protein D3C73_1017530 [compost metagenome]